MKATETSPTLNLKPVYFVQSVNLGCDPEFFFASKEGKTIGSEKVLPKKGLALNDGSRSKCVIDGVQAELNPAPSPCRESLAYHIFACFTQLKKTLANNVTVVAAPVVDIDQSELDSLSEGSRVFGCAPSTNVYNEGDDKTSKIAVDPKKYLKRSAGGHIHLGNYYVGYLADKYKSDVFNNPYQTALRLEKALKVTPEITVPILDYIVGNTAVLIDRDPSNAERRKNYGRCGEYRIKEYGLEYRTLSNFWLRSYPLFSLMFGLARLAILMVEQSVEGNDYVKAIFDAVPREDIIKAIQTNDFDLAYANFRKLENIIAIACGPQDYAARNLPLKQHMIIPFLHFVKMVNKKGIEYWFPDDAFSHWTGTVMEKNTYGEDRLVYTYNKKGGWENFTNGVIIPDMQKAGAVDLNAGAKKKPVVKEEREPIAVG